MRRVTFFQGSQGIAIKVAPTINAAVIDSGTILNWGVGLRVNSRIEFAQDVPQPGGIQVWYQVSDANSLQPQGWIPVRYLSTDYITITDACENLINAPSEITFDYDRRLAAQYAIDHSYDTGTGENHSFLQGQGRTTRRIPSDIPYAYFRTEFDAANDITGSASFVSESIWIGGLPMILGDTGCNPPTSSLLDGWRYCFDLPNATPPRGVTTNPWDTHSDLSGFWSYNTLVSSSNNTVLPPDQRGRLILIDEVIGSSRFHIVGQTSPETNLLPHIQLGDGVVSDSAALSVKVNDLLTFDEENTDEVRMGDYMRIDSIPSHGLVIVGWQEAINCADAMFADGTNRIAGFRIWSVDNFSVTYTEALHSGILNPVPWVADFTAPANDDDDLDDVRETQSPVPRPFYCTMYWEPFPGESGLGVDRFSKHDWSFYTMPDTVSVSPNEIYVDPQWQWSIDD